MRSKAFTLIEILVSLAITVMMMGAVVTLFGVMSDSVTGSRSIIEMTERLRSCRNRLQADLQGVTVGISAGGLQPPLRPENDEGYFELIEGPFTDADWLIASGVQPNFCSIGDADDVLMFTVRSSAEPFVGKFNGNQTVESQVAEVMYFAVPNGPILDIANNIRLSTLYRRVLLVSPALRNNAIFAAATPATFYDNYDVSVHVEVVLGVGTLVPNSLGDLTKRENRFAHYPSGGAGGFPFDLNQTIPVNRPNNPTSDPTNVLLPTGNSAFLIPLSNNPTGPLPTYRLGDDVILTNVLAFDVQVYDPNAPVQLSGGVAVSPTDKGFTGGPTTYGAYVNLGYPYTTAAAPIPLFNSTAVQYGVLPGMAPPGTQLLPFFMPAQKCANLNSATFTLPTTPTPANPTLYTYDTWSLHYENDSVPQNSNHIVDAGTNGLDDAAPPLGGGAATTNGIVDDLTEYDTQPPFPAPLRGIRVIIRAYEPSSQQVREVSIEQDFLPE